jgi:predicted nucleic acid-binding Zn ribbon protein
MNKEILNLIEERLDEGKRKYGHENVETDGRNFITEALEEILDCCVYVAAKLIEIRREMSPLPNHCIVCDKPTMNESSLCEICANAIPEDDYYKDIKGDR